MQKKKLSLKDILLTSIEVVPPAQLEQTNGGMRLVLNNKPNQVSAGRLRGKWTIAETRADMDIPLPNKAGV